MAETVNEKVLDERLAALERARTWSPRVVSKLETLLRSADDFELHDLNPLQFAAEKGVSEGEAIDLMLHATKLGLLEMNWQLVCPMCGDHLKSFASLKKMHTHLLCTLCNVSTEAVLDDFIKVSFAVARQVRATRMQEAEHLSAIDYITRFRLAKEGRNANGTRFADSIRQAAYFAEHLEPGEEKSFEVDVGPGVLLAHDFMHQNTAFVVVEDKPRATELQSFSLTFTDKAVTSNGTAAPGRVALRIQNGGMTRATVLSAWLPPDKAEAPLTFDPFLTGKRLLTTQTFRDLFRSEVIEGTEGIGIREQTLLFTDLKGSTELYERIGDLKAFSLVRQHFDSLGRVIARNSGAVVKTIGDAVMAVFLNPLDATRAAAEMLKEIDQFNRSLERKELVLKIGVHRGASIAVTLNERLDYFGQAVNIAARVQGLAGPEEIYLTEEAYSFDGVQEVLTSFAVEPKRARLKGVQEEVQVYRVAYR